MNDRSSGQRLPAELAAVIREAVYKGQYVPGQRLIEADLCSQYGASRSVVRTALQELANEGLVEVQRHRGARVRLVSLAEAIEITEVRRVVEGLIAARAAERATPAQISELRQVGDAMQQAAEHLDALGYAQLNARVHALVRQISGHGTASAIIERLRGQLVRHQFRLELEPGRPAAISLNQHRKIIEAVAAGDPDAAERAMHEHLDDVLRALRDLDQAGEAGLAGAGLAGAGLAGAGLAASPAAGGPGP